MLQNTTGSVRGLRRLAVLAAALALGVGLTPTGRAGDPVSAVRYYSTAAPPVDYLGPVPVLLARADDADPAPEAVSPRPVPAEPLGRASDAPVRGVTRLATAPAESVAGKLPEPVLAGPASRAPELEDPIVRAKRMIAEARQRYAQVRDYTCTFFKRERIEGRMTPQYVMHMKARTRPSSIYFRFARPNTGREAIYVAGRNRGQVIVHDVGLGKLLAGTMSIDPRSARAMEDNRHPITEAGIGHLIETVSQRWGAEMKAGETRVTIVPNTRVGDRVCTMIESLHPQRHPSYLFHKVKLYIDSEHGLPIRFEAYDWPRRAGHPAELVEEYTYANLRLNVGLSDHDFDPSNEQYSFGRF
jgi:hypothetical protein